MYQFHIQILIFFLTKKKDVSEIFLKRRNIHKKPLKMFYNDDVCKKWGFCKTTYIKKNSLLV